MSNPNAMSELFTRAKTYMCRAAEFDTYDAATDQCKDVCGNNEVLDLKTRECRPNCSDDGVELDVGIWPSQYIRLGYESDDNINGRCEKTLYGTQLGLYNKSDTNVSGLMLGLYNHVGGNLNGVAVGGANHAERDMTGIGVGFLNHAERDMTGIGLGFLNHADRDMTGIGVGAINASIYNMAGIGLGFANISYEGSINGLQVGALNFARDGIKGLQLGLINASKAHMTGAQIAIVNKATTMTGFQLAGFNYAYYEMAGLQLALAANFSNERQETAGLQISPYNLIMRIIHNFESGERSSMPLH